MRTSFTISLACFLMFFCASSLQAQWIQTDGLTNAKILCLSANRTEIFAGNDSGFFRLWDRNATWFRDTALPHLSKNPILSILSIDSGIFVGTKGDGIIHSTDLGKSWCAIPSTAGYTTRSLTLVDIPSKGIMDIDLSGSSDGNFFGLFDLPINSLGTFRACSALNRYVFVTSILESTPTILVGTDNGVWHSTDNGETWMGDTLGMTNMSVISLANIDSMIYAGTAGGGIYRTNDFGRGWTSVSNGLTDMTINALAVCDSILYAGTNAGVFVSTDYGNSWTDAGKELNGIPIRALTVQHDEMGGATIIAGTDGSGVWLMTIEIPKCFVFTRMFPPNGRFMTQEGATMAFDGGYVIKNLVQRNIMPQGMPPDQGQSKVYAYSGIMDLDLSTDGGMTFNYCWAETRDSIGLASTSQNNLKGNTRNLSRSGSGTSETYNMEILGHDIFGGSLPGISFHLDTGYTSEGMFTITDVSSGYTAQCKQTTTLFITDPESKQLKMFDPAKCTPAYMGKNVADPASPPLYKSSNPVVGIVVPIVGPILQYVQYPVGVATEGGKAYVPGLYSTTVVGTSTPTPIKGMMDIDFTGASVGDFFAPVSGALISTDTLRVGSVHVSNRKILQWDVSGGTLPPKYRFRASPTVPSTCSNDFRKVAGGTEVVSFYDIFLELSTDDGVTWSAPDKPTHFELESCTIKQPYQVSGGWNMISVPVVAADYLKNGLFPASVSYAFAYEGSYTRKDTLANRKGYWLKFGGSRNDSLTGYMTLIDSMDVSEGWDMIGSVSRPVPVASITGYPPDMTTSSFFGYDHGYHLADTISPGKGYWVKVNKAGSLILSALGTAGGAKILIRSTNELPPAPPVENESVRKQLPTAFALSEAYPNPFNPATNFGFRIASAGGGVFVSLKVYDVLGREVATLVNGVKQPGEYSVTWNAASASGGVTSGVYFYRLTAGSFSQTRKLVLLR